jgi:hypothetical protein
MRNHFGLDVFRIYLKGSGIGNKWLGSTLHYTGMNKVSYQTVKRIIILCSHDFLLSKKNDPKIPLKFNLQ